MFLYLGGNCTVLKKDVIAILNVYTRTSSITREFIQYSRGSGLIRSDLYPESKEKSYVLTDRGIYFSPVSCDALRKRGQMPL
ncbi:MAG: DUF370 domain-containing protein [Peptococcaceae bacterium]|nr:MAG: DUF370 domain-containing protein [Peptococcaceae bacterium]